MCIFFNFQISLRAFQRLTTSIHSVIYLLLILYCFELLFLFLFPATLYWEQRDMLSRELKHTEETSPQMNAGLEVLF